MALALVAVVVALLLQRRRGQRSEQSLHGVYSNNSRGQSLPEHSASPGLPVYKASEPDTGEWPQPGKGWLDDMLPWPRKASWLWLRYPGRASAALLSGGGRPKDLPLCGLLPLGGRG